MATPIPQKNRPIVLAIFKNGFPFWMHPFFLRPEDITYTYPTRVNVVQTLGGAFADDFGEGLAEVVMNGHTGWRGAIGIPGEIEFHNIRDMVIENYHRLRQENSSAGLDPDLVKMYLVDTLNITMYEVYPIYFQVKKNKQNPLLFVYSIKLICLDNILSGFISDIADIAGNVLSNIENTVTNAIGGLF